MIRSGLRPSKTTRSPSPSSPTRRSSPHLDVVEEDEVLLVGEGDLDGDERRGEPGRSGVDHEQAEAPAPLVVGGAGAHDDEHRLGLVDERR